MASAKRRTNGRWTALYYPKPGGVQKSGGTFESEARALAVAEQMEAFHRSGASGVSPDRKATITIEEYAPGWLKTHPIDPPTRDGYHYCLKNEILPRLGHVRVAELQREQARLALSEIREGGGSASKQRMFRSVLSGMMQTAYDDGYREGNPVRGLKIDKRTRKRIVVMTTDQFGQVHTALPSDGARLMANFIVSTGCRFGEAAAFKVSSFLPDKQLVVLQRVAQQSKKEHSPNGQRLRIVEYTKNKGWREVSIDKRLLIGLQDWIIDNNLGPDDLVFQRSLVLPAKRTRRKNYVDLNDPEVIAGLTMFEGPNGKEYRHGSLNGYVTGKCRCDPCGQASADYRVTRKGAAGHAGDPKSVSSAEREQIIDRQIWRTAVHDACVAADLPFMPTAYQLRHTHASWLIENGVDPKKVMTRLGQASLETTSLYIHMTHGADDQVAADVMDEIGGW